MRKFGVALVGVELCWIITYIALNGVAYSLTSAISEPYARSVRQDVFALGSHVGVVFALCTYLRAGNYGTMYWIFMVFVFEAVRDTFNMVNIIWYSPLRDYPVTAGLHTACMVLSIYQVAMCGIALLWFFAAAGRVKMRLVKK